MRNMMIRLLFLALLCCTWCTDTNAQSIKEMVQTIRKPVIIKSSTHPHLNVEFNHTSHKGVSCFFCHHEVSKEGRYVSCSTCHILPGPRERAPISKFMAFHAKDDSRSCMGCHLRLAKDESSKYFHTFKGCRPCHVAPINRKVSTQEPVK